MCAVAISRQRGEPVVPRLAARSVREQPSVVVVAESPLLRRFVRLALETVGYAVAEAQALGQATGLIHFDKPGLIIVDQDFGGDAWQRVCRDLRQGPTGGRQRLLLLTNSPDHAVTAFVRGLADATVDKPCSADRLRRSVQDQIGTAPRLEPV